MKWIDFDELEQLKDEDDKEQLDDWDDSFFQQFTEREKEKEEEDAYWAIPNALEKSESVEVNDEDYFAIPVEDSSISGVEEIEKREAQEEELLTIVKEETDIYAISEEEAEKITLEEKHAQMGRMLGLRVAGMEENAEQQKRVETFAEEYDEETAFDNLVIDSSKKDVLTSELEQEVQVFENKQEEPSVYYDPMEFENERNQLSEGQYVRFREEYLQNHILHEEEQPCHVDEYDKKEEGNVSAMQERDTEDEDDFWKSMEIKSVEETEEKQQTEDKNHVSGNSWNEYEMVDEEVDEEETSFVDEEEFQRIELEAQMRLRKEWEAEQYDFVIDEDDFESEPEEVREEVEEESEPEKVREEVEESEPEKVREEVEESEPEKVREEVEEEPEPEEVREEVEEEPEPEEVREKEEVVTESEPELEKTKKVEVIESELEVKQRPHLQPRTRMESRRVGLQKSHDSVQSVSTGVLQKRTIPNRVRTMPEEVKSNKDIVREEGLGTSQKSELELTPITCKKIEKLESAFENEFKKISIEDDFFARKGAKIEKSGVKSNKKAQKEIEITPKKLIKEIIGLIVTILIVVVVTFLLIEFVAQRTEVDGTSMESTLHNEDNLIVDKISYNFNDPERFDIVVFPYKSVNSTEESYYIKRIIGLPGERVQISNGFIYINGELLEENYGKDNELILNPGLAQREIQLAEDEYFVLGDNRNNSSDSREIGNIKRDIIVGRAWLRIWPLDDFGLLKHQ